MSLHQIAKHVQAQGRGNDTQLMHVTPSELNTLQSVAKAHGGSLTINPSTGLPEAGFLDAILPAVAGAGLSLIPGVGPLMAAGIVGAGTGLLTKDLNKGLLAGLGAFGGASLAGGLMEAGAGAGLTNVEAAAAANPSASVAELTKAAQSNIDPSLLEGMSAEQVAQANVLPQNASNFDKLLKGTSNTTFNADFFKKNLMPLGAIAAPLLMGGGSGSLFGGNQQAPSSAPGYIRPYTFQQTRNPGYTGAGTPYFTQTMTPGTPVAAADWGATTMADGGITGLPSAGPQPGVVVYDPVTGRYTQQAANITPTVPTAAPVTEPVGGLVPVQFNPTTGQYVTPPPAVTPLPDPSTMPPPVDPSYGWQAGDGGGDGGGGGGGGDGGGDGGGAGGGCVDPDVLVLMASGEHKKAGEILVGDFVHAPHQDTLEYGDFEVLAADIITQPKLLIKFDDESTIKVSDTHKFLMSDNAWKQMLHIKLGDVVRGYTTDKRIVGMEYIGEGDVVKFNVDQAHTYVSDGLVSHNDKKEGGLIGYAMGGDIGGRYASPDDMGMGDRVGAHQTVNMAPHYPMQGMYQGYAQGGGITNTKMAAVQQYSALAASSPDGMKQVMAKAKAGDYNAMTALNNLQGTPNQNYAGGGISHLGGYSDGGRLLKGPGDGVSDDIPAQIGARQPARLADGEFVVPARIVSELGNGSTEAGAKRLYAMMDRVQKDRKKSVGKNKVAVDSKSYKHLPA